MAYKTIPKTATIKPETFEARISDVQISKFKQLLELSELGPKTYENTTDDKFFGVTWEWMQNAKKYWLESYDWRQTEASINSFPNYTASVPYGDDNKEISSVHFIALFSEKPDAIPIILMHGWPGSFLEFLDLLNTARSKYSAADLPYHLIVPSLPGYGYSATSVPINKDHTVFATAEICNNLMCGLGFGDGYIAQGGDVGSVLARIMAVKYDSCKAAHLNFCMMPKPESITAEPTDPYELAGLKRGQEFRESGMAYAIEHGTRPSTIGFVLSSSPLALLAWIGEKFQAWSDTTPPLPQILDSVTLYWHTQCFPRSIYPYRSVGKVHASPDWRIASPKLFGFSSFPKEVESVPRSWLETTGNLIYYNRHESGGHFAALEKPAELFEDVEEFVKVAWKRPVGKL